MSKFRNISGFFLLLAFFVACGMGQDPLRELPENYRDAVRPGDNTGVGPFTPNDFLQVDVEPAIINFKEGEEGLFFVRGRTVDLGETSFDLELVGLPEGFFYDEDLEAYSWTPPLGFVSEGSISEVLVVNAVMTTSQQPFMSISKPFNIWVHKKIERPEVLSVIPRGFTELKEDSIAEYIVRYRMVHGNTARLSFVAANNANDLSPFLVQNGNPEPTDVLDEWELRIGVNLRGKELTEGRENFHFGVMVYSSDGVQSSVHQVTTSVVTQVSRAVNSWEYAQIFEHAQLNKFSFQVYIPKATTQSNPGGELTVEGFAESCQQISTSLSCRCLRQSLHSFYCTVEGAPLESDIGFYQIEFESVVNNPFDVTNVRRTTHHAVLEIL